MLKYPYNNFPNLQRAIYFEEDSKFENIMIDNWIPNPDRDIYLTHVKGAIIAPVSKFYGVQPSREVDYFSVSSKKCYNSDETRSHICHYINYFETFYDQDNEYLAIICHLKPAIEQPIYNMANLITDIRRYILYSSNQNSIPNKVHQLVEDNYYIYLNYKSTDESLQYTDEHAKILLEISFFMNLLIPVICHFADIKKIPNIDNFLMEIYDEIFGLYPHVDIMSKLYETANSSTDNNRKKNEALWATQDIRGIDVVTHSHSSQKDVILNIIPRYNFNKNIVMFNYTTIRNGAGFRIIDAKFEFSYVPLSSSSNRNDENASSDFDKYESHLIRQNEAYYLQNKVNSEDVMRRIDAEYGPFDQDEIQFYIRELSRDRESPIHFYQKNLVFLLFMRYFGDPASIKAINSEDYIKLIITSRRILEMNGCIILPYIISSRMEKIITRKSINKSNFAHFKESPHYLELENKYRDAKKIDQILSTIATIIASDFRFIDYHNKEINGRYIEIIPDIIMEEVALYYLMV